MPDSTGTASLLASLAKSLGRNRHMNRLLLGTAMLLAASAMPAAAQSGNTLAGAAIGAGTGALIAGPPGAVVGGVIGAVVGAPPKPRPVYVHRARHRCYFDAEGYRHCRW